MNTESIRHWDLKQFIPFIYVFLVEADRNKAQEKYNCSDHHIHTVLSNVFFLSEQEKWQVINEVKWLAYSINEQEKMEVIKYLGSRIDVMREVYELVVQAMNDIARSDGNISVEEHSAMFFVRLNLKKDYVTSKERVVVKRMINSEQLAFASAS